MQGQEKLDGALAFRLYDTFGFPIEFTVELAEKRNMSVDTQVFQKGSNINSERLRFDFSFSRKMTVDEIEEVEKTVNDAISNAIDVVCTEICIDKAQESGAIGIFESKYGELVKVYDNKGYSSEICGGPHAENTSDLGSFRIIKEQSSSSGVRRIKDILE